MRAGMLIGLAVGLCTVAPAMADPFVTVKYNEHCGFASAGQIGHLINSDTKRSFKVVVKEVFNPWGGGKPTETLKTYILRPMDDRPLQCSYGNDHYPYKLRWTVVSESAI